MAEAPIARNPEELARQYEQVRIPGPQQAGQEFRELQIAAGDLSSQALEQAGIGAEFEAAINRRLGQKEISPELRKREREAIAELFAAPEGTRAKFEGVPIDPARVSQLVSGRMNNYLTLLDDIRGQQKTRQSRIDDIIKETRLTAEAGVEKLKAELSVADKAADRAWDVYKESVRQREFQQKLADSGTKKEKELDIKNSLIEKWNTHLVEKSQDPNWSDEFNGIDPDFYSQLVEEARGKIGDNGVSWFVKKYPPGNFILNVGDNYQRLEEKTGITKETIALGLSKDELKLDFFDALNQAIDEEDLEEIKLFYGQLLDLEDLKSAIRDRLRRKFGDTKSTEFMSTIFSGF